ncbi:hypothetical protein [Chryseobacterium oryctis]|uniref:YD repeat-containing protein n=1 Tax=Chryseobacterium oryctis TaxID=2952618 RepID=A0ABT3HL04_9FLAO|nr:hypothetical protein [Chryseobacterium oryctis]MCW3160454.1 hypothetical protein [Chryseobacterium oryctis]
MKNYISVIILLVSICNAKAQLSQNESKSYVGNINEMFAAAPTANNLMKFEEVPVSYYTGVPDINIPIFNIPTSNKDVAVNVQLKYHTLNAKPEDRSGETGLGWSLIAGGSIIRTVRGGGPDEKNRTIAFSTPPKSKFGIYNHIQNPTYKIINNDNSFNFSDYTFYAGLGRYDTEYDLYQYNFAGHSGRFFVVKNTDGSYSVEKLDKNNLKITCGTIDNYGAILSFTITDDKGIKYVFDGKERSQKDITTVKVGLINGSGDLSPSMEIGDYFTSFHLVQINDQNNTNLVQFNYDLSSIVKYKDTPTTTRRLARNVSYVNNSHWDTGQTQDPDGSLPGSLESQTVYTTSQTKLLTSIIVNGKATIYLNYEQGRQDSNYLEPQNLFKLKSVQSNLLGQSLSQYVEKFTFDYDYSNVNFKTFTGFEELKKLLLKKVIKISSNNGNSEYNLDYYQNSSVLDKDDWGYYKIAEGLSLTPLITTDVLKSITYPTKGKVEFIFEENEYSYLPNENVVMEPLTGEWVDVENTFQSWELNTFNDMNKIEFFTIQSPQKVTLHLDLINLIYSNWNFKIYKKNLDNTFSAPVDQFGMSWQSCISTGGPACPNQNLGIDGSPITEIDRITTSVLDPGTYYISLSGSHGMTTKPISYYLTAHTKDRVFNSFIVKNGGGIRIAEIKYFDINNSLTPAKNLNYSYHNIENPQRSSGALVFPKPIFKLTEGYSFQNKISSPSIRYSAEFDITTDYNILPVQKTQGGDVGYKYVTVEQVDSNNNKKGRTEYKFRSPIDYPNEGTVFISLQPIPIPNQDYLRGQLISEKKFDDSNNILEETINDYASTSYEKTDGVKLKDVYANNMIAEAFSYAGCPDLQNHGGNCNLASPYKTFEKFGITLPSQKIETFYFYKNGVQSSVSATTNTLYNSLDYPTSVTQLFSDGNSNVASYKYAHEKGNQKLINAHMIGIPLETEVKKNSKTISKVETRYDNPLNLFPSSVKSYDLQNNESTEVTYDRYDNKGNLEQYTTKDGIPVAIVWGYNQTQPIAKIEGATYAQVSGLISSIVSASDADALAGANNDETALLNALKTFKDNLPNAQVTTYTYDPLIGVRSITPPSGIREVYLYDSANRLKEVRENNQTGRIIKEYQYNYKN